MEKRREVRIARLIQALKRTNKIHLQQAARLLGVSEMTVRRDLNVANTSIALLGGYIVCDPSWNQSHAFISRHQLQNVARKRQLADVAATFIQQGDTVFF